MAVRSVLFFVLVVALVALAGGDKAWFEGRIGLQMLYQYGYGAYPEAKDTLRYPSSGQWNSMVESFDVEAFAGQMMQAGLSYVCFFPAPRHSTYSTAPSAVFDSITGSKPGQFCSRRDLLKDLGVALQKRGMRLLIQWPFADYTGRGATDSSVKFRMGSGLALIKNRYTMLEEYAKRYGTLISGYWFYSPSYAGNTIVNQDAIAMVKKYNPGAIVAICDSWDRSSWFKPWSVSQEYTAGECWKIDTSVTPKTYPAPSNMLWHLIVFLSTSQWKEEGVPVPSVYGSLGTEFLSKYVSTITSQSGTVEMSIKFSCTGKIDSAQFKQMNVIGLKVNKPPVPPITRIDHAMNIAREKPAGFQIIATKVLPKNRNEAQVFHNLTGQQMHAAGNTFMPLVTKPPALP